MEVAEFKEQTRAVWAAGDYAKIAELLNEVGEVLVERVGVATDEDVLDVACGNGNAAVRAAQADGKVVGLDLTPELFEDGDRWAQEVGVEVDWVEGDAEDLPFTDESFDVVLSSFGCMFAPHHEQTAQEIVRVLRPGGRIALSSWTPESATAEFFATLGKHLPSPPPFASPPVLWGDEDHVEELFADSGLELSFEQGRVTFSFDSVEEAMNFYRETFGVWIKARELLEPLGQWAVVEEDMRAFFERYNEATDGSLAYSSEYLIVTGVKR